ncbi:hypothetical protein GCM10009862_08520 [Microbacterium binotii]|uniref:Uncharacterized protein n=1 Tax=Microbacterium binotii TaxID=462710 RepID=A0ABN3P728_9MICO
MAIRPVTTVRTARERTGRSAIARPRADVSAGGRRGGRVVMLVAGGVAARRRLRRVGGVWGWSPPPGGVVWSVMMSWFVSGQMDTPRAARKVMGLTGEPFT